MSNTIKKIIMVCAIFVSTLGMTGLSQAASEELGIYEKILNASGTFEETTAAFEAGLGESGLTLQAKHDIRVPDGQQQSRIYVLTSPAYMAAAGKEAVNTISGQILRVAIYTHGEGKKTYINMTNPVAHAMVFYSESEQYDDMIKAAEKAAQQIRDVAAKVPGESVSEQLEPMRSAKKYRSFNGDGPAKMMAKWRNWESSQRSILEDKADNFDKVVAKVEQVLSASQDKGKDDASGWHMLSKIAVGENAVYFGITNKFTEDKIIRINSDYRKDGKTKDAPYPGVDHSSALPIEVLVIKDGDEVKVVQYGEMWRMQLYFWDSGYRAFAKNTFIPSAIFGSIEDAITKEL